MFWCQGKSEQSFRIAHFPKMLYGTALYCTALHLATLHCPQSNVHYIHVDTVLHGSVMASTVMHGSVMASTVMHGSVMHGTVMHGSVMQGTQVLMYCTAMNYIEMQYSKPW